MLDMECSVIDFPVIQNMSHGGRCLPEYHCCAPSRPDEPSESWKIPIRSELN